MSREQLLDLPGGRTLAYEHMGILTSSVVVIFFSGTLSVGTVSPDRFSLALSSKNVHYIAPTLPGYGNTSPPPNTAAYATTIATDTSALLNYLYPDQPELELYISGGSFGTVAAQILYGSSFDLFPQGRHLKKMLLLGPMPPFAHSPDGDFSYTQHISWMNYIAVGPPTKVIPFRLVQRLLKPLLRSKLKTQETAEVFNREMLIGKMCPEEKEMYRKWREAKGYEDGQLEKEFAEMNRRSIAKSWEGLMSTADVLHSEWWGGKRIEDFDEEHTKGRKVLVVTGEKDDSTPPQWAEYLASKYPNAELKLIGGGHIGVIFYLDEIWERFMNM